MKPYLIDLGVNKYLVKNGKFSLITAKKFIWFKHKYDEKNIEGEVVK